MGEVITIGVDLAKNVFQVHGVDAAGAVVICRQLRRAQMLPFFRKRSPCLVGMETCATAHHWARQLIEFGHEVKLMPPHYVKPYVKRNKNDAADAQAICEAVTRPTMRFVSVKGTAQQSVLMLHRTRELLVRQRTMLINAMRAVIYARYSSENQRDASIEDQVRQCRGLIERRDWTFLHSYADRGMSGASPFRVGYQKLLEDARDGVFDVVVAEPSTGCRAIRRTSPGSTNDCRSPACGSLPSPRMRSPTSMSV
jgi:hypothetical protein